LVATAVDVDTALLAMAMVALGLTTNVSAIKTAGLKPLGLAAILFGWLIAGGILINVLVSTAITVVIRRRRRASKKSNIRPGRREKLVSRQWTGCESRVVAMNSRGSPK